MADSPRDAVLRIMNGMVEIIDQELAKWADDPGGYTLSTADLEVAGEVRAALTKLRELRD